MARLVYFGEIRTLTGVAEEAADARSVRRALVYIRAHHGMAAYRLAKTGHILVDGESARFSTRLTQGSEVRFLPVCGGG